jgi:prepilin-type N-terminal cleavage/methylation domain-containing protein
MCVATQSGVSHSQRPVAVDWQDCGWCPLITVQVPVAATPRRRAVKPLSMPSLLQYRSRHDLAFFTTMKTMPIRSRCPRAGFTIVELLTVIAIIGILAAMLVPVLSAARKRAQKVQARLEIDQIVNAILKYDSDYGRFPVSTNAQIAAGTGDFTYGGTLLDAAGNVNGTVPITSTAPAVMMTNEEVIAILMDLTNYPNGQPVLANMNYAKNPQQTIYLSPKMSDYNPAVDKGQPPGGLDLNGAYRDPWGNPYIITLDLNYDENCRDSFYCLQKVSQQSGQTGYNGLFNSDPGGTSDNFQYRGKVMVWSAGPDGKIASQDGSGNAINAISQPNKDNVLSWQ